MRLAWTSVNHANTGRGCLLRTIMDIQSKAPVSQLVNADDTSVIEIKTQLYLES